MTIEEHTNLSYLVCGLGVVGNVLNNPNALVPQAGFFEDFLQGVSAMSLQPIDRPSVELIHPCMHCTVEVCYDVAKEVVSQCEAIASNSDEFPPYFLECVYALTLRALLAQFNV